MLKNIHASLNAAHALANGASIRGIGNEMVIADSIIFSQYSTLGFDCIITCGVNGEHSRGSEHYKGDALDYRTRHMPDDLKQRVAQMVKEALGQDFDVVLEPTHLHVEYDPKTPLNMA